MDIGPKRTAHDAIKRVAEAIAQRKTRVLDFDLRAYFDNVRHDRLLEKVAQRVDDKDIMHQVRQDLRRARHQRPRHARLGMDQCTVGFAGETTFGIWRRALVQDSC
jgi:hypothetical protein